MNQVVVRVWRRRVVKSVVAGWSQVAVSWRWKVRRRRVSWSESIAGANSNARSEVVTNALRHAAGGGDRDLVLDARLVSGMLRVAVHDPDPTVPTPRQVGGDAEQGRGLRIVAAQAKERGVIVRPGGAGKTVWFTLTCQPALSPAADT